MEKRQTIVILTSGGLNPALVINALSRSCPDIHVIVERPESKLAVLKRRARLCGPIQAFGQLATMIASRLGKRVAQNRSQQIIDHYKLSSSIPAKVKTHHTATLNSEECLSLIKTIGPQAILSVSCRIIHKRFLAQMPCPVINLHAGINPAYRGQMGGYWARVEQDEANFGATIHLVDKGVDTGATLYETRVKPNPKDTISTYPLLITAAAIPNIEAALSDVLNGEITPIQAKVAISKLRYPPAIWTWVWHGVTKGIW